MPPTCLQRTQRGFAAAILTAWLCVCSVHAEDVPPPPAPTLAEQLQALLERAAREPLTVEQQADLEQVFLAYWSRRLNLSTERLSEAVTALRKHPQGGSQLNRIERWLHARPTTAVGGTANELLHELGFQNRN